MPNIIRMGSCPPSHFTKLEFFARPLRLILGDFQKYNPLAYLLRRVFTTLRPKHFHSVFGISHWCPFSLVCLPLFRQQYLKSSFIGRLSPRLPMPIVSKIRNGIPLDGGLAVNGDGSLATLGYFDQATGAEPFKGNWIPMTFGTTVGDSSSGYGYDDGMFSFTTIFTRGSDQVLVYPNEPAGYSVNAPFVILSNSACSRNSCLHPFLRSSHHGCNGKIQYRYRTQLDLARILVGHSDQPLSQNCSGHQHFRFQMEIRKHFRGQRLGIQNFAAQKSASSGFRFWYRRLSLGESNNPGGLYEYDSSVSITAVADPHFEFVLRWNGPVSHPPIKPAPSSCPKTETSPQPSKSESTACQSPRSRHLFRSRGVSL